MIKKLLFIFVALIAINSYGQQNTASPYSFYGIGSLKFKGTVENRSMGGLSIYTDSIHLNLRNPASFTGNDLETINGNRPVKYGIGATHTSTTLKSDSGSSKASSTSIDYLALNFPVGKFGVGFGLMPYTAVGYKLESLNADGNLENKYTGEGGLNKVFLGMGYQINKSLSFGINLQYNFGNIQNSSVAYLYDQDGTPIVYQSKESNRSDLSGLNIDFGLTYKTMLNQKLQLISGATYTPQSNLSSLNQRYIATVSGLTGQDIPSYTVQVDLKAQGLENTTLVLPSKYSFGAGIGEPLKWFVGAEYNAQKTSNFSNALYSSGETTYEDASGFALGGFYIPEYNAFSGYLNRVVYRAGLRYEKTGLQLKNESIKEFGISFGVGVPVGTLFSNANLGVELGKRGTTNSNLIEENFINVYLSLSLNDLWFQKKKYN
ncbi:hypothetical protein [Gaetbulibacter aestuarii]|uniref:Long-chain fatty acid transport protein n=1 Tax=Gaetbulibacter aestuarii TaxID=1502358 RepID=A0ABW7N232_9FLAO